VKYLYFSAPWCGPCRMFGPIMEEVSKEIPVQKVNVDDENDLAMQYGVRSVPTIVLVNENGKELSRHVGVQQKSMVLENYKSFSK
jgi:thioredoxin 1